MMCLNNQQKTEDIHVHEEELLLAVPRQGVLTSASPETLYDISSYQKAPFAVIHKESTARELMEEVFHQSGISPNIIVESSRFQTMLEIINEGICCYLISSYYRKLSYPNVTYYAFANHPSWQLYACYKKDTYLSEAEAYIIDLVSEKTI